MKYIILCGGIGLRINRYSLPKPLNYIKGRHLIEYIIDSIQSNEIYIVYNELLDSYNFKEIIINKFKNIIFHFSVIDFLTRGAVETAYIGVNKFNFENDNILFIDNDNVHELPVFNNYKKSFIGYGIDYERDNYSFITIKNDNIINIEEKKKISDNYCCGLYGFANVEEFQKLAKELIENNGKTKNEFYFSQLYKLLINKGEKIIPVYINKTIHLGTHDEMIQHQKILPQEKLRICFDFDNTLVTYPTIPGDYTSVKPITSNIELLNKFKNEGHEIIIYTARRMATHNGNVGKVIKDIGIITFNTLEKFNIQYDELIFGKPIADIYIDDKALNPYYNSTSLFGLFDNITEHIPNKIDSNKYNKITKKDNFIYKLGPYNFTKGEIYFYQNIPDELSQYFPKLIDYNKNNDMAELKLEYINGIPLYYLYKSGTLTTKIIDKIFDILEKFHNYESKLNITMEDIKDNYILKLKNRFNKNDYYFEDAESVFNKLIADLEKSFNPIIKNFIHGDFWFSNIILTYNDEFKFIDMKGQVNNILSTCGDIYYDYGKLYQSILGYDLVLHRQKFNYEYLNLMNTYFLSKCTDIGLDINYLKIVTKSLIFGTFYFLKNNDPKQEIWDFLNNI
jgi:capsule biosynthesis phosphatase